MVSILLFRVFQKGDYYQCNKTTHVLFVQLYISVVPDTLIYHNLENLFYFVLLTSLVQIETNPPISKMTLRLQTSLFP